MKIFPHQKKSVDEKRMDKMRLSERHHQQRVAYWATLYQASPDAFSSILREYPDIADMVHSGFKARRIAIGIDPQPGEFEREMKTEYERRQLAEHREKSIQQVKRGR